MNLVVQILKPSREKSTLHGGGNLLHGEVHTTPGGAYYTGGSILHEEEHSTRKGAHYTGKYILHRNEHIILGRA